MKSSKTASDLDQEKEEFETLERKFQNFVLKQEQTLRVSIYLLLNLSEDIKVFSSLNLVNSKHLKNISWFKWDDVFKIKVWNIDDTRLRIRLDQGIKTSFQLSRLRRRWNLSMIKVRSRYKTNWNQRLRRRWN